jgi:hypothetical protein
MAYDTETLLGVYRELDPFNPFLLNLLCSAMVEFEDEAISFDKLGTDKKLAPFVSPMVAGKSQRARGGQKQSFTPAYVKPKNFLDPKRVVKRQPGEAIGGSLTTSERRQAILVDIMDEQRKKIKRREEWMVAQIVQTGKVIVEGEDYPTSEVDFQRDPNLTIDISGGAAAWDQSTAKPDEDLEDWFALMMAPATHVIMGRGAYRKFISFETINKRLLDTMRGSETVLEMAPSTQLASFKGRLGGSGPEVWTYAGYYEDANGDKQLFIPDNGVAIVSTGSEGLRAYGAILDGEADYVPAEYWPKNWVEKDPGVEQIMTQSAPLPCFLEINGLAFATVY